MAFGFGDEGIKIRIGADLGPFKRAISQIEQTVGKNIGRFVQGYHPTLEQAADRIPELKELAEAVRDAKADLSAQANAGADPTQYTGGGEIVVSPATERPQTLRYRIAWERSSGSWTIQAPTARKASNGWKAVAWLPKLEQAARSLFDTLMLEGEEVPSIEALREEVRRTKEVVIEAIRDCLRAYGDGTSPDEAS